MDSKIFKAEHYSRDLGGEVTCLLLAMDRQQSTPQGRNKHQEKSTATCRHNGCFHDDMRPDVIVITNSYNFGGAASEKPRLRTPILIKASPRGAIS